MALFCSNEGNPGKTFDDLKRELKDNEIISTMDFFAPLKKDKEATLTKARTWVKSLI